MFSGFREDVEIVPAYQRPWQISWFSDRPENTNLVEDVYFLLPINPRRSAANQRLRRPLVPLHSFFFTKCGNGCVRNIESAIKL